MIRRLIKQLRSQSYLQLNSRDAYSKWAASYPPLPHNVLMEVEQETMLSVMPELRDKTVLDLACGTGRYALIAQEQGARYVLGIDDSFEMLKMSPLAQIACGSMTQIPLTDGCMDVVICGLAVGHSPDLYEILTEIARVLVDDGQAIISDFHPFLYLSGARRTFTQANVTFEVEHYPHLYETLHDGAQQAGLTIETIKEPQLTGQKSPVVIVYVLRKSI